MHRNSPLKRHLLAAGCACYLLACALRLAAGLRLVAAGAHRNPFGNQLWALQQQQHQQQPPPAAANDEDAAQARAIAQLLSVAEAARAGSHQVWAMEAAGSQPSGVAPDSLGADEASEQVYATFNGPQRGQMQQQQQQEQHFQQPAPPVQHQHQHHPGSTVPSVNRQLMAPPPFYELALAPTNALQLETNTNPAAAQASAGEPAVPSSSPLMSMQLAALAQHLHRSSAGAADQGFHRPALTARSLAGFQEASSGSEPEPAAAAAASAPDAKQAEPGTEAKNSDESAAGSTAGADDKLVEPRQRRRIFNRILKKAEWNHLFVELSKVFLKYFLDLALKDIIGKQSGADSTTSRKKLDAQSELTDLLKDFFKTAISNI